MSQARIRLYTTPWCSYCVRAKRLLDRDGLTYVDHDVARDRALRRRLSGETGWRTVPMIFVDDEFVGGYTELARLRARGGLEHLKEQAAQTG